MWSEWFYLDLKLEPLIDGFFFAPQASDYPFFAPRIWSLTQRFQLNLVELVPLKLRVSLEPELELESNLRIALARTQALPWIELKRESKWKGRRGSKLHPASLINKRFFHSITWRNVHWQRQAADDKLHQLSATRFWFARAWVGSIFRLDLWCAPITWDRYANLTAFTRLIRSSLLYASPRSSALHFRPPRISTQCRKLAQSTDCLIQPVWPRLRCILLLTRPEKGETNRISSESGKFLAFSSQLSILSRDWETKIEKASSIVPFFCLSRQLRNLFFHLKWSSERKTEHGAHLSTWPRS